MIRPWEFDLDSVQPGQPGPGASSDEPITEPVPVVSSTPEPATDARHDTPAPVDQPVFTGEATAVVPAMGTSPSRAESSVPEEPAPPSAPARPSTDTDTTGPSATPATSATSDAPADRGTPWSPPARSAAASGTPPRETMPARPPVGHRTGRTGPARRAPARMKAKRPDDPDGTLAEPLAAEPPGASVADVPGRRAARTAGLAGLAAADRIAEQEHPPTPPTAASPAPEEHSRAGGRTAAGVGSAAAWTADAGRPLRSSSNYAPEVTGGHPPAPVTDETAPRERPSMGGSTGLRVGTGVAVAVVALLAFKLGTVTSLILSLLVVTFAAGEAFAVLRRAGWRPATLLGLVGTISLMVGAYNKGIAALPLVLVLITVFTLLWYLFGVERGSAVAGTASTLLVVGLGGPPRILRRAAARPLGVPRPARHRLPPGRHHRHRRQRRRGPGRRAMDRQPPTGPERQPQQDLGGAGGRCARLHPGVHGGGGGHPPVVPGQRGPARGGGRRGGTPGRPVRVPAEARP